MKEEKKCIEKGAVGLDNLAYRNFHDKKIKATLFILYIGIDCSYFYVVKYFAYSETF